MSYTQIHYHIIFSTKNRTPAITENRQKELYNYLWGILKNKKCHLHQIGGIEDHLHLLTSLHPTISLADLIRDLKTSSTQWIKKEGTFPNFIGWQSEYGAFTKSNAEVNSVIKYIKNQKEHHRHESFIDEFKRFLKDESVVFNERYLH